MHWFRTELCVAKMTGSVDDDNSMLLEAAPNEKMYFVRESWGKGKAGARVNNDAGFASAAAAAAQAEAVDPAFADASKRCARVTSFKGNFAGAKKFFNRIFRDKTGNQWKGETYDYPKVRATRGGVARYCIAGVVASSRAAAASSATLSSGGKIPYRMLQRWAKQQGIKASGSRVELEAAMAAAAAEDAVSGMGSATTSAAAPVAPAAVVPTPPVAESASAVTTPLSEGNAPPQGADWYTDADLEKVKVKELRKMCERLGLPKSGLKPLLLRRLKGLEPITPAHEKSKLPHFSDLESVELVRLEAKCRNGQGVYHKSTDNPGDKKEAWISITTGLEDFRRNTRALYEGKVFVRTVEQVKNRWNSMRSTYRKLCASWRIGRSKSGAGRMDDAQFDDMLSEEWQKKLNENEGLLSDKTSKKDWPNALIGSQEPPFVADPAAKAAVGLSSKRSPDSSQDSRRRSSSSGATSSSTRKRLSSSSTPSPFSRAHRHKAHASSSSSSSSHQDGRRGRGGGHQRRKDPRKERERSRPRGRVSSRSESGSRGESRSRGSRGKRPGSSKRAAKKKAKGKTQAERMMMGMSTAQREADDLRAGAAKEQRRQLHVAQQFQEYNRQRDNRTAYDRDTMMLMMLEETPALRQQFHRARMLQRPEMPERPTVSFMLPSDHGVGEGGGDEEEEDSDEEEDDSGDASSSSGSSSGSGGRDSNGDNNSDNSRGSSEY
mgnify:CR=1 FL=1